MPRTKKHRKENPNANPGEQAVQKPQHPLPPPQVQANQKAPRAKRKAAVAESPDLQQQPLVASPQLAGNAAAKKAKKRNSLEEPAERAPEQNSPIVGPHHIAPNLPPPRVSSQPKLHADPGLNDPHAHFKDCSSKAEQNDRSDQYQLGLCYLNGRGVGRDLLKALEWFEHAANQGLAVAQFEAGRSYYEGRGVTPDPIKATPFFRLAADQRFKPAIIHLCQYYANEGNDSRLAFIYSNLQKADLGDRQAQYEMAFHCYMPGHDLVKNPWIANHWYEQAAIQEHPEAQCNLAFNCQSGIGIKKDLAKAVYWYQKAADNGHAHAQFSLASCFFQGEGVAKNAAQALAWNKKAAEQHHIGALFNLGSMYENGQGVVRKLDVALDYYLKASRSEMMNYVGAEQWKKLAADAYQELRLKIPQPPGVVFQSRPPLPSMQPTTPLLQAPSISPAQPMQPMMAGAAPTQAGPAEEEQKERKEQQDRPPLPAFAFPQQKQLLAQRGMQSEIDSGMILQHLAHLGCEQVNVDSTPGGNQNVLQFKDGVQAVEVQETLTSLISEYQKRPPTKAAEGWWVILSNSELLRLNEVIKQQRNLMSMRP